MTTKQQDAVRVTADMSVAEFLACHPNAGREFFAVAPAFAGLSDPVLREQIGRATSLARAAKTVGMSGEELIGQLRRRLGLAEEGPVLRSLPQAPSGCGCGGSCSPAGASAGAAAAASKAAPAWAASVAEADRVIDADEILGRGESPLGVVLDAAAALRAGEVLGVRVAFRPTPMIERMQAEGYSTYCRTIGDGRFELLVTPL